MGLLLRHFRKKKPDDTRSDYLVLAGYIDEYGEDWLRTRYPEDWDQFQDEIGSFRPQSTWEELKRGAVKGAHGLYGTAKGTVALGIDLIPGDTGEETSDKLLASAAESFKEASRPGLMASGSHPIASLMGQAIPSLTESIVTGVAGAAIGAAVVPAPDPTDVVTVPVGFFAGLFGKAAIKNEIKDRIVLKLGKEALEESVEKTYKEAIGKGTKKELEDAVIKYGVEQGVFNASKKLIGGVAFQKKKIAAQYASTGTVLMNSIGLSSGEIYNQLRADENVDPDTALTHALMGGVVAGTPEAIMPAFILRKAIKGIRAPRTIAATDTTYRKIVNSFPGRLAKNLGGGMATEGATEAFQAWVGIVTEKTAKGMSLNEAISDPLNYSEKKEIEHSAKAGLAAGFLGGGLSVGVDSYQRWRSSDPMENIREDKETETSTKLPASDIPASLAYDLSDEQTAAIDDLVNQSIELLIVRDEGGNIIDEQSMPSDNPLVVNKIIPLLEDGEPVARRYYQDSLAVKRKELTDVVKLLKSEAAGGEPTTTSEAALKDAEPKVKAILDALYVDDVDLALERGEVAEETEAREAASVKPLGIGDYVVLSDGNIGEVKGKMEDELFVVPIGEKEGSYINAEKLEDLQRIHKARAAREVVEPEVVTPAEEAVDGIDGLKKKWDRFNPDSLGKTDPNPKAEKTVIVDKNQDSSWKILKTKVQAWASKGKDADEIVQKLYNEGLGIDITGRMTRHGVSEEFYEAVKAEVGRARGAKAKVVTPAEEAVDGIDGLKKKWDRLNPDSLGKTDPNPKAEKIVIVDKNQDSSWKILKTKVQAWASKGKDADEIVQKLYNEGLGIDNTGGRTRHEVNEEFYEAVEAEVGRARGAKAKVVTPETTVGEPVVEGVLVKEKKGKDGGKSSKTYRTADGKFRQITTNEDGTVFRDRAIEVVHTVDEDGTIWRHVYEFENGKVVDHTIGEVTEVITDMPPAAIGGALTKAGSANVGVAGTETGFMVGATTAAEDATSETFGGHKLYTEADPKAIAKLEKQRRDEEDKAKKIESLTVKPMDNEQLRMEFINVAKGKILHLETDIENLNKEAEQEATEGIGLNIVAKDSEGLPQYINDTNARTLLTQHLMETEGKDQQEAATIVSKIKELNFNQVKDLLEARGFTQVEKKTKALDQTLSLLAKKKRQLEEIQETETLLENAGVVEDFPVELIAFHTQEADKSLRTVDNYGRKIEPPKPLQLSELPDPIQEAIKRRNIDWGSRRLGIDEGLFLPNSKPITRENVQELLDRVEADDNERSYGYMDGETFRKRPDGERLTQAEAEAAVRQLPDDVGVEELRRYLINDTRVTTKEQALSQFERMRKDRDEYKSDIQATLEFVESRVKKPTYTYPAFYSTQDADDSVAGRELATLVKEANDAIISAQEKGESTSNLEEVNNLGKVLVSDAIYLAPKGIKGSRKTTRLVVLMDHNEDAKSGRKYQVVSIDSESTESAKGKTRFRVTIPVGQLRDNTRSKYVPLDKVMAAGFEPVASIRMAVPTSELKYQMDAKSYTALQDAMLADRGREASRIGVAEFTTQAGEKAPSLAYDEEAPVLNIEQEAVPVISFSQGEETSAESYSSIEEGLSSVAEQVADTADTVQSIIQEELDELEAGTTPEPLPPAVTDWIQDSVNDLLDALIESDAPVTAESVTVAEVSYKLLYGESEFALRHQAKELVRDPASEYIKNNTLIALNYQIGGIVKNEIEQRKAELNAKIGLDPTGEGPTGLLTVGEDAGTTPKGKAAEAAADQANLVALNDDMPIEEVNLDFEVVPQTLSTEAVETEAGLNHQAQVEKHIKSKSAQEAQEESSRPVQEIIKEHTSTRVVQQMKEREWSNLLDNSNPMSDDGLTTEQKQEAEQELYRQLNYDDDILQLEMYGDLPAGKPYKMQHWRGELKINSRKLANDAITAYGFFMEGMEGSYIDNLSKDLGISYEKATEIFSDVTFATVTEEQHNNDVLEAADKLKGQTRQSEQQAVHGTEPSEAIEILKSGTIKAGSHFNIGEGQAGDYTIQLVYDPMRVKGRASEKEYRKGEFATVQSIEGKPKAVIIDRRGDFPEVDDVSHKLKLDRMEETVSRWAERYPDKSKAELEDSYKRQEYILEYRPVGPDAVKKLAESLGIPVIERGKGQTRQSERPLVPQRQNSIEDGRENTKVDQGILESFVNWYDDKLKSAFSVFNFEREGLSDIEIQDRYIKGLLSLNKLIQEVEHGVFTENMPTETVEQKRAKAHTDQTIATTIKSLQKRVGDELRLSINEGMLGKASPGLSSMLEKFVKRAESGAQNQGLLGGRTRQLIYHGRVPPEASLLLNLDGSDKQEGFTDESQPSGWTQEGWVDNSMDVALSQVRKEVGDTVEGLVKWLGVEDKLFGKLLLASEKLRNIQVHLEVYDPSSDDNKITYGRYNDEGGPSWAGVREADAGSTTLYLGEHLNKDHLWLTFKHEMLHGMFFRAVHNYETVAGENLSLPAVEHLNKLSDLLERSRRAYEEKNKTGYIDWSKFSYDGGNPSASPLYGLSNLDEFISEAMSDQKFIEFLKGVPGQTKGESLFMTILGKLKELAMQLIRDLRGRDERFSESAYGETVESIIALYVETEETGRGRPVGDQMRAVVGKTVRTTTLAEASADPAINNNSAFRTNVAAFSDIHRVFAKLFKHYNDMGVNVDQLDYKAFVKELIGKAHTPKEVIARINTKLGEISEDVIDESITSEDLADPSRAINDVYNYLRRVQIKIEKKANKASSAVSDAQGVLNDQGLDLQKLIDQHEVFDVIGKATEKQMRIFLSAATKKGRTLSAAEVEVRKILAPKKGGDTAKVADLLQAIAALQIDFNDRYVSREDVVNKIMSSREVSPALNAISNDTAKQKIAVEIMVGLGKTNQYLFDFASLAKVDESNDIAKILNEAIKPDSTAIPRARAMITPLKHSARLAERLLHKIATHKKQYKDAKKALSKANRMIEFRSNTFRLLNDELSLLEEKLGVEWRATKTNEGDAEIQHSLFQAVEGAEYLVPSSPSQTPSSLRKVEPKIYTLSPRSTKKGMTGQEYRNELKGDLYRINQWLNYPNRTKDAAYNYMLRVKKEIERQVLIPEYTAGQSSAILKLFGTFKDNINRIGSPILNNLSTRITKYVTDSERFHLLAKQIDTWTLAERRVRVLLYGSDPNGKAQFRAQVYEPALAYFENNQQILEEAGSVEEAIDTALKRIHIMFRESGGELAAKLLANDDVIWPAIENHLRETGKMSKAMMNQQEDMGLRVREGTYFRKAVGAELFTVSRSISNEATIIVAEMRKKENGWLKPVQDVSDKYQAGTLREEVSKKFTTRIWEHFVRPVINITGVSQFKEAGSVDRDIGTMVSTQVVQESFEGVDEGDLVTFAENLYSKTGGDISGTPEALEAQVKYVEGVLKTFDGLFSTLHSNVNAHYDPEKVTGNLGTNIRRPMMDARVAKGYPHEWMEYSTYEEQSVLATMRALAANAAFGESLRGFKNDITAALAELEDHKATYRTYQRDGLTPSQIKKEAIKKYGPAGYKMIKNASGNIEHVKKIGGMVEDLIANDAKTYDFRSAYEVIGALTGLVVQSVKTGIIDTSSLFVMPWVKYGFNTKAFIESAKGLNIIREGVGSTIQTIGIQVDLDGGLHKIWNELNLGDPDALRVWHERMVSSLARDVPYAETYDDTTISGKIGKWGTVASTKGARTLSQALSTGIMGFGKRGHEARQTTIKPWAPFTMMGQWMVAANTKNVWRSYIKMVQDAVTYLQANPEADGNIAFTFNHKNLGLPKEAFEHMVNGLAEHGMSIEALAQKAMSDINAEGDRPELFTMDQYRQLAILAQTEFTKETSALTRPTWVFTTPLGRMSNALIGWSIEKGADVARNFKLRDEVGDFSMRLLMRSSAPYLAVLPASLAFVWMRKEWEEEVVGKKANMLEFNSDMVLGKGEVFSKMTRSDRVWNGLLLPMLDQTTRAGVFGILGDFTNAKWNPSTGRDFHIENRIFFMSLIFGAYNAVATWIRSGTPLDWQNGFKPIIQSTGGGAYIESAQILQRTFGIDSDEVRITKRLNTDNWLRTIGRQQGLDVQVPSGARGTPNPVKPHLKNMAIAALANDPIRFEQARLEAQKELRKQGKLDEEGIESKIKENFRDYHPARRVFKTLPIESEYQTLINGIPEGHRAEVNNALELYNSYCERLGVAPFRGKTEKGTTKTSSRKSSRSSQQDILRQLYGQPSRSSGSRGGDSKNNRNDILRKALGY